MQTLTVNVQSESVMDKLIWMLEHFKNDGVEIVSTEDIEDLKLLKKSREEATLSFDEYLAHAN
ncbi:MAG: hypothetical protein KU28_01740 [Sulfurovum sp. PC08-66]|nr:MAG: hypothetical protein KU28_01740 [Sulfurovum sp. PC08-66]KIM12658.1 MAG: hypothetical protein KU37_01845 [Sulfuricurvum sp. PC08-66]